MKRMNLGECLRNYPFLLFLIFSSMDVLLVNASDISHPSLSSPGGTDEQRHQYKPSGDADMKSLVKYALAAKYLHTPLGEETMLIAPRPVRKLGDEFLGKRSSRLQKRAMGSEFLGKRRAMGSEFLGKRAYNRHQTDDYSSSEATEGQGSDWAKSEYNNGYPEIVDVMHKPSNNFQRGSDYIEKRKVFEMPSWKQALNSRLVQFGKKRRVMGSEFLGKRSYPRMDEESMLATQFANDKATF